MRVTGVDEKAPLDDVESGDGKTNLQILEGWIAADPISERFREPWTAVLGKGPFEKRVHKKKPRYCGIENIRQGRCTSTL